MIQLSPEKQLADVEAELANLQKDGGPVAHLHAITEKVKSLEMRLRETKRALETSRCELSEIEGMRRECAARMEAIRFDPNRLESVCASDGGLGAFVVALNYDRTLLALQWWLNHAKSKIESKEKTIKAIKARCADLEADIVRDVAERGRLQSEVDELTHARKKKLVVVDWDEDAGVAEVQRTTHRT